MSKYSRRHRETRYPQHSIWSVHKRPPASCTRMWNRMYRRRQNQIVRQLLDREDAVLQPRISHTHLALINWA